MEIRENIWEVDKCEFLELAKKRYSVRSYKIYQLKRKILADAGRISPSACISARYFIVIEDNQLKEIAQCYPRQWLKQAL